MLNWLLGSRASKGLDSISFGESSSSAHTKTKDEMHAWLDFSQYSQVIDFEGFLIGLTYPKTQPLTEDEIKQREIQHEKWLEGEKRLLDEFDKEILDTKYRYYGYVEIQNKIVDLEKIKYENNVEQIIDLMNGAKGLFPSDIFKVSLLHLVLLFGSSKVFEVYLSKFPLVTNPNPNSQRSFYLATKDYGNSDPSLYAPLSGNYSLIEKYAELYEKHQTQAYYGIRIDFGVYERYSRFWGYNRNAVNVRRKTDEKLKKEENVKIPSLLSIAVAVVGSTLNKYKMHPRSLDRKRVSFPVSFPSEGKNKSIIEGTNEYFLAVASILSGSPTALDKLVHYLCDYCPEHSWEILNELSNLAPLKNKVTLGQLIRASQAWEGHWREIYVTFLPHLDQPPVIDVFQEYHTFTIEPEDDFETKLGVGRILKKERGLVGSPSIVNVDQFRLQFNAFTRGLLQNLNWNNVVVMGGAVIGSLLSLPPHVQNNYDSIVTYYSEESAFKGSDIDIYIYGLDKDATIAKIKQIHSLFEKFKEEHNLDLVVTSNDHIMTLSLFYPYRNTQLPVGRFKDIFHILSGADLDSTCFAYNGKTVYTLPRGRLSVNRKWNYINTDAQYNSRESPFFEQRILKYNHRGFTIVAPKYKRSEQLLLELQEPILAEQFTTFEDVQSGFWGLGVLVASEKSDHIYKLLLDHGSNTGLPFGPSWTKEKYIEEVNQKYESLRSGYSRDEALPKIIPASEVSETISRYNTYFNFDLGNASLSEWYINTITEDDQSNVNV
eukprot:TRINITY_DN6083_c0_g1_i1.p1 TRINITY_DN6083_c0_g1~~TRINITY_DN6083_c0_g1_i1.p1  ORF type:complete len:771 (-),score=149.14 TRINITY_DN6083_c0_g1_i1:48-2360(-)